MPIEQESAAVALARAHAEAWSNHDWEKARMMLAHDVHLTTTSTQSFVYPMDLSGSDVYMNGLIGFAQKVEPGSAHVIASVGDARNSLLLLTVRTAHEGQKVTLPMARLALFDENQQIKKEQVVYFAVLD